MRKSTIDFKTNRYLSADCTCERNVLGVQPLILENERMNTDALL